MTAIHGKMERHTRNRWKLNLKKHSESKTLFLSGERGACLLHMFLHKLSWKFTMRMPQTTSGTMR